jgi:large subunit ribosomal protein L6
MSKIGKSPVVVPQGVTVTLSAADAVIKGPKGELKVSLMPGIAVKQEGQEILVSRQNDLQQTRAAHGLIRSLIAGAVQGVTEGYKKTLKLVGTGYRVAAKGASLSVTVGFSHPVDIQPLPGVTLKAEGNDTIHVEGFDKQAVGQMAANIRAIRPPEPYQGKGIRYENEVVKTKPGKTVTASA